MNIRKKITKIIHANQVGNSGPTIASDPIPIFTEEYCKTIADQILNLKTDFWEGFKQFTLKEFLIRFDGIKGGKDGR